jgi:GNAT superfamily N-acetyltransferase
LGRGGRRFESGHPDSSRPSLGRREAGVERDGDELVVRSVAVAPERRRQGVGRGLLNALADVATARRLVAETDEDAVGF